MNLELEKSGGEIMCSSKKKSLLNKSVVAASAVFACVLWLGGLVAAVPTAQGDDMYIYPKEGQDKAQQDKDTYECHSWAVGQTGFDPTKPPSTGTQTQTTSGGQAVVGGAAKGAAVGAVGGAIGGDAAKGAAIGAGVGAASGGIKKRGAQKEQEAQQQAANQAYQNDVQGYNRAKGTCLEGRSYSVSY
jgi:hypothetical protein